MKDISVMIAQEAMSALRYNKRLQPDLFCILSILECWFLYFLACRPNTNESYDAQTCSHLVLGCC